MPKRLLDSSYLNSPSLAKCSPGADDAWPRFILFADDFGCFEVDARRLAVLGWNAGRQDVTPERIETWLEEYVGAGMAVLWTENERRYCYLTGWFGDHGQRRRVEYDSTSIEGRKGSRRRTPVPPPDLVAGVLAGVRRDHDGKPPGTRREDADENPKDSVPAREIQFPAANPVSSRGFPAHAVAVAVARSEEATSADASSPPLAAGPVETDTRPAPKPESAGHPRPAGSATERKKADPLRRSLSDALVAVGREERGGTFAFDGAKDAQALSRLLGYSRDVQDHARRFRLALRSPAADYGYRVDTIAAFATGRIWNHFAPVGVSQQKVARLGSPGRE